MNEAHLEFLSSPGWRQWLEEVTLPWVLSVGDLGDDVLEVGPGPGLTTDLLRTRVARLTVVESDERLAAALADRLAGTNVEVIAADAAESGLATDRFSGAACFSMLHHVPSTEAQDRVLAELCRVLRPGGTLVAVDSRGDIDGIREHHEGDVFVPLEPETLDDRLGAAGFHDAHWETADFEIRFAARKP